MLTADRISLKRRVLSASAWSIAGYGLSQIIRFGSNLLMTRLLVPEVFGIMAISSIVMVGLAMFSDLGLKQCVIQSKRGDDATFLNTAWVMQIIRGVVLWILASIVGMIVLLANFAGAVPKDTTYADPRLSYVIFALSFTALISGFQSTKLLEANRTLSLGFVTRMGIVVQVIGLLCTLAWVLIDRSIWALVAGNIFGALLMALFTHIWLPGIRNRWEWDRSAFREIIQFGKWIFLSSILGFLVSNGDRLLLGGLVSATVLGVYTIAFSIFNSVEQLLNKFITDVLFSAFSEIARERPLELRRTYYKLQIVISSSIYFFSGVLMFSGQQLVDLLYDHRYQQAGWMLSALAIAIVAVSFNLGFTCLLALGLARLFAFAIAVRAMTLFVSVPLGFQFFGVTGAVWAIVLSYFSPLPLVIYYRIKCGLFDVFKELLLLTAWPAGVLVAKGVNLTVGN